MAGYLRWRVHLVRSTCTGISSAVKMKLTIVATVLLGLLLTPALAEYVSQQIVTKQFPIVGGFQIITINRYLRVATIEQRSNQGSWKTVWNYNLGYVASKVQSQGTCYVSVMNRNVIPRFDSLLFLAEQSMGLKGQGQPTKQITLVVKNAVRDLTSYGTDIVTMCRGLTTYLTYEVYGPQNTYNYGTCTILDVLRLVDLKYCLSNSKGVVNGYQPF
ncbi:gastrokine-1-like [Numenius arquata]|uniref:gastrokine-1-like n=1 Tax=Numenius arquata TaxID=31919 RepID=UPI003D3044A9